MTDTDMLYMAAQEKRIAELENENRELKRLLKSAVEDIFYNVECGDVKNCEECCCDPDNNCHWRNEQKALKLIGE